MTHTTNILLLGACAAGASAVELNPIRKVVNLLQSMQKKVEQEGEQEKELYEKFMCYCSNGGTDLSASISAAEEKIPAVSSDIETAEAKLSQAKADLKQAQTERAAAKASMKEATAIREKEAADYAKYKADADANVAAMAKAVAALEKGMAGSFLQSSDASTLRRLVSKVSMADADQQTLLAFLSQGSDYAPRSGEITGILKQMGDTMVADLADATKVEEEAIANYKALMVAKTKEVALSTKTVENKSKQIGELGVDIVQMKEDVADTAASLKDDQAFLANLESDCATKTAEWEERS
jgi:chromosome segregation ATPase